MKSVTMLASGIALTCLMLGTTSATADALHCSGTIKVLAQPRDGLTLLEKYKSEFTKLSGGATFQIDYLNENDRRAKSKADASTVGRYNVYYIDEANVALFASSGWIQPLLKYYPKQYDYADFDPGRRKVATYDGTAWYAPLTGGGDMMVYRTDLLKAAGLTPPKTLDEYIADVKKLNDPAHGIYGTALRGQRGSGANVWRWMPFFRAFGGKWFDGNTPVFDSAAAVKATQTYLDLFKYSAPGTKTGSWDEAVGAFTSGQVAMLIESTPLVGMALDPKESKVYDKIGFAPPPAPLVGGGYAHGLAIGTKANKTENARQCAGLFIGWATSKQNEKRRLDAHMFSELNRTSILTSPEFAKIYGPKLGKALAESGKVTAVTFWQSPLWPQLGNRWGITLEELIAGNKTDVKASLDDLNSYAKQLIANNG